MTTRDRNPAAILRSLKKYTQPAEQQAPAEAGDHKEFTIDELAREAGSTVRNVRAYQDRGILRLRRNAAAPAFIRMCIWHA